MKKLLVLSIFILLFAIPVFADHGLGDCETSWFDFSIGSTGNLTKTSPSPLYGARVACNSFYFGIASFYDGRGNYPVKWTAGVDIGFDLLNIHVKRHGKKLGFVNIAVGAFGTLDLWRGYVYWGFGKRIGKHTVLQFGAKNNAPQVSLLLGDFY